MLSYSQWQLSIQPYDVPSIARFHLGEHAPTASLFQSHTQCTLPRTLPNR